MSVPLKVLIYQLRAAERKVEQLSKKIEEYHLSDPSPPLANPASPKNIFSVEALDPLYQLYPRKISKKIGLKRCQYIIRSQKDFDLVRQAIENYKNYCQKNQIQPKFIKHFSTFMSCWEDWIEPNTENHQDASLSTGGWEHQDGVSYSGGQKRE